MNAYDALYEKLMKKVFDEFVLNPMATNETIQIFVERWMESHPGNEMIQLYVDENYDSIIKGVPGIRGLVPRASVQDIADRGLIVKAFKECLKQELANTIVHRVAVLISHDDGVGKAIWKSQCEGAIYVGRAAQLSDRVGASFKDYVACTSPAVWSVEKGNWSSSGDSLSPEIVMLCTNCVINLTEILDKEEILAKTRV